MAKKYQENTNKEKEEEPEAKEIQTNTEKYQEEKSQVIIPAIQVPAEDKLEQVEIFTLTREELLEFGKTAYERGRNFRAPFTDDIKDKLLNEIGA